MSSTSLVSMISNQTATTEYSPNLIENECGDLLKISNLDISRADLADDTPQNTPKSPESSNFPPSSSSSPSRRHPHSRPKFELQHSDSELDTDYLTDSTDEDQYDVEHIHSPVPYRYPEAHAYSDGELDASGSSNTDLRTDILNATVPLKKSITSTDVCGACMDDDEGTIDESSFYHHPSGSFLDFQSPTWDHKEKWAFILIGLPASGKSTMIHDFQDYVATQTANAVRVRSYNAGDVRRQYELEMHSRFDFNNLESSKKLRDFYAFQALQNLTNDLINDVTDIGILDATNTSKERRETVVKRLHEISESSGVTIKPLFFEVKCSNKALRRFNIEKKSHNKDYIHMPREQAINDFLERIHKYELSYECVTLDEIKNFRVKYFGIDNVGDSIYYDCGLEHHDNSRHKNLSFTSISLNLMYQFLINYRTNYAAQYLTDVDEFYTGGHYKPIHSVFSKPVSLKEMADVKKEPSDEINSVSRDTNTSTQSPAPVSAPTHVTATAAAAAAAAAAATTTPASINTQHNALSV